MADLSLPVVGLLFPILAIGAIVGYRRSWARETITGLGLALILIAFDQMTRLVVGVVALIARAVSALAAMAGARSVHLDHAIHEIPAPFVSLVCLVAFIVGAYWVGHTFGGRQPAGSRFHRAVGVLLGLVNVVLLLTILSKDAWKIFGRERMQHLFLVPGSGKGLSINLPAFPSENLLLGWSAYAVVIVVAVAVAWGVSRLSRFRG